MSDLSKNEAFTEIDALFDATLDDLDDLPPFGVPPTGHYNLSVTGERKALEFENGSVDAIVVTYTVEEINEIAEETERADVKEGQTFTTNFVTKMKNGEANKYAIAAFKEFMKPYCAHFGDTNLGSAFGKIKEVKIAATIKRIPNKKTPEFPKMKISDIIVL